MSMGVKFKSFEIRGKGDKYELVKWQGKGCFVVGWLEWDRKEECFSFQSCGLRYLQYRENGLADWLLAWCKMKEIEYHFAAEEEEQEESEEEESEESDEEAEEDEEDDATAGENTDKVATVGAASLGYMNTPASLSDEEWELICSSFTHTIKEAEAIGTAFFSCPIYLSCKKCPLKGHCQEATYSAEVWEKLEKQWKAQYEYNEKEECYE